MNKINSEIFKYLEYLESQNTGIFLMLETIMRHYDIEIPDEAKKEEYRQRSVEDWVEEDEDDEDDEDWVEEDEDDEDDEDWVEEDEDEFGWHPKKSSFASVAKPPGKPSVCTPVSYATRKRRHNERILRKLVKAGLKGSIAGTSFVNMMNKLIKRQSLETDLKIDPASVAKTQSLETDLKIDPASVAKTHPSQAKQALKQNGITLKTAYNKAYSIHKSMDTEATICLRIFDDSVIKFSIADLKALIPLVKYFSETGRLPKRIASSSKTFEEAVESSIRKNTPLMRSEEEIRKAWNNSIARLQAGVRTEKDFGTYEDGVIAALEWVLGAPVDSPVDSGEVPPLSFSPQFTR